MKYLLVLTAIFVAMRAAHIVEWSALWLLSPLWIPVVLWAVVLFLIILATVIVALIDRVRMTR